MSLSRALRRQEARQAKSNSIPTVHIPCKDVIHAMRNDYRRQRKLDDLIGRLWGWDDWPEMSMAAVDLERV